MKTGGGKIALAIHGGAGTIAQQTNRFLIFQAAE
jgi:hypothetical protein